MRHTHTQTPSRAKRVLSAWTVACFVLALARGPLTFVQPAVAASSFRPNVFVNTEAFLAIDDDDTTANVTVRFGDTLAKTITFNRSNDRFEVNDDVSVTGMLRATGTVSGSLATFTGAGNNYFKGNVGIGTTAPSFPLHVERGGDGLTALFNGASAGVALAVNVLGTENGLITTGDSIIAAADSVDGTKYTYANGLINALDGKIGIGTTAPNARFHASGSAIVGNLAGGNVLIVNDAEVSLNSNSDAIGIGDAQSAGNGTVFTVDDPNQKFTFWGGNVGIGTTAPQANLHVVGTETRLDTGTSDGATSLTFVDDDDEKAHLSLDQSTYTFDIQSDGRLTIGSNDYVTVNGANYTNIQGSTTFVGNNVGIGTSGPKTKLEVVGTISGASLFASDSLSGAGLVDCDGGTSKLLWDATTGRFSCGTVTTSNWSNTGSLQTHFDNSYVNTSGDTMTGPLVIQSTSTNNLLRIGDTTNAGGADYMDIKNNAINVTNATELSPATLRLNAAGGNIAMRKSTAKASLDVLGTISGSVIMQHGAGNNTFMGNVGIGFEGFPVARLDVFANGVGPIARFMDEDQIAVEINKDSIGSYDHGGEGPNSLYLNPNGGNVGVGFGSSFRTPKATLEAFGSISGIHLYAGNSINGAGLVDCDNGTTSKLLWDSSAGRFSCGTDQGATYTAGQGLSLNGTTFKLNATVTGSTVRATTTLASSGTLTWEGAGSGASLAVMQNSYFRQKLGVGSTAPDTQLEINSPTGNNLRLTYDDADGSAANYADFIMSSDGKLTIDATGQSVSFEDGLLAPSMLINESAPWDNSTVFEVNGHGGFSDGAFGAYFVNATAPYAGYFFDNASNTVVVGDGNYALNAVGNSTFDGAATFNDGAADRDFRVESVNQAYMFFVDASTDRVGIGSTSPKATLDVVGTVSGASLSLAGGSMTVSSTGDAVFNENGANVDFRVESDANANGLFFDASARSNQGALGIGIAPDHNGPALRIAGETWQLHSGNTRTLVGESTSFYGGFGWNDAANVFGIGTGTSGFDQISVYDTGGAVVINEPGDDADFRVESDGDANAFVVDGGTNNVGIGTAAPKSKLAVVGTVSGTSLFASDSLSGAGLVDCDNGTTSKLLWDSSTGRFSCGTDQSGGSSGGGISLSDADARYVKKQGDTMTGTLAISNAMLAVTGSGQFTGSDMSDVVLRVKGNMGQSANLQEWVDGNDTMYANVTAYGDLNLQYNINANYSYFSGNMNAGAVTVRGVTSCGGLGTDMDGNVYCAGGGNNSSYFGITNGNVSDYIYDYENISFTNDSYVGVYLDGNNGVYLYSNNAYANAMNQNVGTGDNVTFYGLNVNTAANMYDANVSNNLSVGNVAYFNGTVGSNVSPLNNNSYDLGSGGSRWATGYFANLNVSDSGYVSNNLGIGGVLSLGSSDGNVYGNVTPYGNNTFNVGSPTNRWASSWFVNANVAANLSVGGNTTLSGNVGVGGAGTSKAKLDVLGTVSGTSLFASNSLSGAGLVDCDNGTTSKLLWDSSTGRFSCGTDQSGSGGSGGGNYVSKGGDTMTGTLAISNAMLSVTGSGQFTGSDASDVVLRVKGNTGQSANLQEWTASNNSMYVNVTGNGAFNALGNVQIGQNNSQTLTVHSNSTFNGNMSITNSAFIGGDNSDYIYFGGDVNSSFNPDSNNSYSLGNSSNRWIGWLSGLNVSGNTTLGGSSSDTIYFAGAVNSNLFANSNNAYNVGNSTNRWSNGWFVNVNASSDVTALNNLSVGNVAYFNGSIASNVSPLSNNSYNVGSSSNRWATGWFANANLSGNLSVTGNTTIDNLNGSKSATSGSIMVSRTAGAPEWKSPTGSMVWYLDGVQTVGASKGAAVTMAFGLTATSVNLRATGAPTGAAYIVDIKENGTTIFSTKPQINAASVSGGGSAVFSDTDIAAGSVVTVDVTQIGSTFAGSGITVQLNGIRKY